MVCFPHAKINIGLNILRKRQDGYHDLETVFYPVAFKDVLEIIKNEGSTSSVFNCTGLLIDSPPEKNLCIKAYNLLKADYDLPPVSIHLHKIIPLGAGLGGGSSDAAFMLKTLNALFDLKIGEEQLVKYAASLGSDCAFFISSKPSFASGRGEILNPISLNLNKYYVVIIIPPVHVSTAEAYGGVKPYVPSTSLSQLIMTPVEEWKNCIFNDFEKHIFEKHPRLAQIKKDLYNIGALYASMSGSGSSIYGIFGERQDLDGMFTDCVVWKGQK